jgi:hypothetical protein
MLSIPWHIPAIVEDGLLEAIVNHAGFAIVDVAHFIARIYF